jgi:hypothetical protein
MHGHLRMKLESYPELYRYEPSRLRNVLDNFQIGILKERDPHGRRVAVIRVGWLGYGL